MFGLTFLWAWTIERKRHYLLLLAVAPYVLVAAATAHTFFRPSQIAESAIVGGFFDTSAVLITAEGILRRSGKTFGCVVDLTILGAITGALWYFSSVVPNVLARVYLQNFSYGLIFLVASLQLASLRRGKATDRALFWILLLFALHFFPRTALTMSRSATASRDAFDASLFFQALNLSIAILGVGLALAILAAALSDLIADLRHERDVDILSGTLNRRGFENRASASLTRAANPCALIVCDLDHFKQINDRYGHPAGDGVLRAFGSLLQSSCRAADLIGRIGGEEFAILMPGATIENAIECAERLRLALLQLKFECLPYGSRVTTSLGVAEAQPGENLLQLLARADQRLYQAKASGRNRTVANDDVVEAGQAHPVQTSLQKSERSLRN